MENTTEELASTVFCASCNHLNDTFTATCENCHTDEFYNAQIYNEEQEFRDQIEEISNRTFSHEYKEMFREIYRRCPTKDHPYIHLFVDLAKNGNIDPFCYTEDFERIRRYLTSLCDKTVLKKAIYADMYPTRSITEVSFFDSEEEFAQTLHEFEILFEAFYFTAFD